MAKYEEPFEDIQELFTQGILNASLNHVNITILVNNKAKEIFKLNKANDLLKHRTGDDIIIVINQNIFDKLTPQQKTIVVEESLASIHYDNESSTLTITKPDVVTYSGLLSKYTFSVWNTLRESIKTLYAAQQQAEDEARAATEKAKAEKNKKKYA